MKKIIVSEKNYIGYPVASARGGNGGVGVSNARGERVEPDGHGVAHDFVDNVRDELQSAFVKLGDEPGQVERRGGPGVQGRHRFFVSV